MVAFVPDPSWPSILELAIMLWGPVTGRHANGNELRFGERESKSIMLRELVWRDHEAGEGGGYKEIHERAIGPLPPRGNGQDHSQNGADRGGPKPWLDIGTIYRYLDADGHLVLEVIRTISGRPRFRQR